MNLKRRTLVGVVVGLCLSVAGSFGALTSAAQAGYEPGTAYKFYFPIMLNQPTLYGRVTQVGAPVAGVAIQLRLYNGSAWTTQATTTTDASGHYRFIAPPRLSAGQKYLAAFNNTENTASRLAWWTTPELTSYSGGASARLGDFDIAAVTLEQPSAPGVVGLPAQFRWTRRPATPGDSYTFRMCDWNDYNPMYQTGALGYTDSFTLSSLPLGFSLGTEYAWDVVVSGPDGGRGASLEHRGLTVLPGLYGQVKQGGAAAAGVPLELRYFNGSVWSTRAATTTAGDGTYAFASPPTLGAGQLYYVRYVNNANTAGRLYLWSTHSLSAYTTGTSQDLGTFDIADIPLVNPPGGSVIGLPHSFQWTRRPATTNDAYLIELFDPADLSPRWLSPAVGYAEAYALNSLPGSFGLSVPYAWDVIVLSPNGGSGVSRLARLVTFTSRGALAEAEAGASASAAWPFPEELPPRPSETLETGP